MKINDDELIGPKVSNLNAIRELMYHANNTRVDVSLSICEFMFTN